MSRWRTRGAWLVPLLAGCRAPSDGDVVDSDGADPGPLPVVTCGTAPWTRLHEPLGELLDHAERPDLSFSATALDVTFGLAGLPELAPTPHDVVVEQLRYTTQDRGVRVEATGLVAVPTGDVPAEPWPVVLLLHSFSGLQGPCAPSAGHLEEAIEPVLIASRGFVVIAPDDIGLDGSASPPSPHAPLVAEQAAVGAWDALRAGRALLATDEVRAFLPRGVRDDVVVWGYSQGGHAALATERLGAWLAPHEHVAAVIAGVPPLDVRAALTHALSEWSDGTGLAALVLVGMHRWYDLDTPLSSVLSDAPPGHLATTVAAALEAPATSCDDVDVDADTLDALFAPALLAGVASGDWIAPFDCLLDENSLSTMSIAARRATPTLLVFGTADTVVDAAAQRPGVAALCGGDAPVRTLLCDGGDHAFAALWSIPEQEAFVRDRLAGVPLEGACEPEPIAVRCAATSP